MSKTPTHQLTEDEWNELSCAADEAYALTMALDLACFSSILDARVRRNVEGGCVSALRHSLEGLLARLEQLEPCRYRPA